MTERQTCPSCKRQNVSINKDGFLRKHTFLNNKKHAFKIPSKRLLNDLYINQCLTYKEISNILNIPKETIRNYTLFYNISSRPVGVHSKSSDKEIRDLVYEGKTVNEIALILGYTRRTASNRIYKLSIQDQVVSALPASHIEFIITEELKALGFNAYTGLATSAGFVDIFVKDQNLIIEYDGEWCHSSLKGIKQDKAKSDMIHKYGFALIRIREGALEKITKNDVLVASAPTDITRNQYWAFSLVHSLLDQMQEVTSLSEEQIQSINSYIANGHLLRLEKATRAWRKHQEICYRSKEAAKTLSLI